MFPRNEAFDRDVVVHALAAPARRRGLRVDADAAVFVLGQQLRPVPYVSGCNAEQKCGIDREAAETSTVASNVPPYPMPQASQSVAAHRREIAAYRSAFPREPHARNARRSKRIVEMRNRSAAAVASSAAV